MKHTPKTQKKVMKIQSQNFKVVSVEMQGWRDSMEDEVLCQLDAGDGNALFAVFDGHRGNQVSKFLGQNFLHYLKKNSFYRKKDYSKALKEVFIQIDAYLASNQGQKQLNNISKGNLGCFSFCISKGSQKPQEIGKNVGSTANVVLITQDKIYVANAGDSRSVMLQDKTVFKLSSDHKPQRKDQRVRILKNGATITAQNRINGQLNVSRGFGDFRFKNRLKSPHQNIVSCVPDVLEIERTKKDKFILIGCDGFWQIQKVKIEAELKISESLDTADSFTSTTKKPVYELVDKLNQKGNKEHEALIEMFDENVASSKTQKDKVFDNMTAILILFK